MLNTYSEGSLKETMGEKILGEILRDWGKGRLRELELK